MFPVLVTLCAMQFTLPEKPPSQWLQIVAQYSSCQPRISSSTGSGKAMSAARINDLFPHFSGYWPLIGAHRSDLARAAREWLNQGVTPGILLPARGDRLTTRTLDSVRALAHSGAAVVLRAPDDIHDFGAMATLYAAQGLLVNAVYVGRGYAPDLEALPKGLYLVAPHWQGKSNLPLPQTRWVRRGRRFIAVPTNAIRAADRNNALGQRPGRAYTPKLGQSWTFAGLNYRVDANGEHSSLPGWVVQWLLGMIAPLIRAINTPIRNVGQFFGADMAWTGIAAGGLSALILMLGALRDAIRYGRT